MENIDFDNNNLSNDLMSDRADLIQNPADEINNEPIPKSGKKRVSFIFLAVGYFV